MSLSDIMCDNLIRVVVTHFNQDDELEAIMNMSVILVELDLYINRDVQ